MASRIEDQSILMSFSFNGSLFITHLLCTFLCDQRYKGRSKRYQHSGSMVTGKGGMEQMLKEHEKNIQEAVRKARINKSKELWDRFTDDSDYHRLMLLGKMKHIFMRLRNGKNCGCSLAAPFDDLRICREFVSTLDMDRPWQHSGFCAGVSESSPSWCCRCPGLHSLWFSSPWRSVVIFPHQGDIKICTD